MSQSNNYSANLSAKGKRITGSTARIALIALVIAALCPQLPAFAGTITGTTTDLDVSPAMITINGLSFGAGLTEVFLVLNGLINGLRLQSTSDTVIVAELPADVGPGTYLLAVDSSTGLAFFDATIGTFSLDKVYDVECGSGTTCSCDSVDHVAVGGGATCRNAGGMWNSYSTPGNLSSWTAFCDLDLSPIAMFVRCLRPYGPSAQVGTSRGASGPLSSCFPDADRGRSPAFRGH